MSTRSLAAILLSFLLFHVFNSEVMSQEPAANTVKRIHVKMEGSDSFREFGYSIIKSFESAFTELNILTENDTISNIDMEISILEIDSNKAAVSVIVLESMPKEVIDIAAKAEILYAKLSEEKKSQLPIEGKFIREYASSEYLKQFRMLIKDYLEIIDRSKTDEFASRVVKDCLEYIKSFKK